VKFGELECINYFEKLPGKTRVPKR